MPVGNRVIVDSLYRDYVILENDGRSESLVMYEENETQTQSVGQTSTSTPTTASETQIGIPEKQAFDAVALVQQYGEQFLNAPGASKALTLASVIKITPAQANGQLLGYQLSPGEEVKRFVQIGFKTNDIVTAIDGIPLDDINNLPELYQKITTQQDYSLSILREGRPMQLEISLAE